MSRLCTGAPFLPSVWDFDAIPFGAVSDVFKNITHGVVTTVVTEESAAEKLEYERLLRDTYLLPEKGHNVLIVQPRLKNRVRKSREIRFNTEPCEQEARALVDSLENWMTVNVVSVIYE
ncbi:hypothetical protein FGIG_05101 [Fasciola gigantica]|uniref:Uncharacterized protein n=1 Tax=Fasciola gigantica TaxID=46835 RepID=A0A504YTJ3_FASGI|nr:hypothetical protein FGIG_05101 [Fasciola gigantica]